MKLFTMLFNALIAMFSRNIAMFMASTTATAQSYNDTNVIGQVLQIGATKNTGRFLSAIGGLNGARRVASQTFDMSATYALDAPSPTDHLISESTSLSAGTAKFHAKTPVSNVVQIMKYDIIVSDLRESAKKQIVSSTFVSDNLPIVSEFDNQAAIMQAKLSADWEAICLAGSYVARSAVDTGVAAGGLLDTAIGIQTNSVNASSASLDSDMIAELLTDLAENGAPMENLAIVARPKYIDALGTLYGFAPQDRNVGGVQLKQIFTTYGPVSMIWTNAMSDNNLIVADLAYIQPVVLPHYTGNDILMKEYADGASAQKGFIQGYVGVDFGHESYHGKIYGLA